MVSPFWWSMVMSHFGRIMLNATGVNLVNEKKKASLIIKWNFKKEKKKHLKVKSTSHREEKIEKGKKKQNLAPP